MIPEAERLAATLPAPVRAAFDACYIVLADEGGCEVYVKTIYVGFSIQGEMVAAIYPRRGSIEVAMALPEDFGGAEFKDATHLTWPTMPVSVELPGEPGVSVTLDHLRLAIRRVAEGDHNIRRPNEHFIGRLRRGNSRRS